MKDPLTRLGQFRPFILKILSKMVQSRQRNLSKCSFKADFFRHVAISIRLEIRFLEFMTNDRRGFMEISTRLRASFQCDNFKTYFKCFIDLLTFDARTYLINKENKLISYVAETFFLERCLTHTWCVVLFHLRSMTKEKVSPKDLRDLYCY